MAKAVIFFRSEKSVSIGCARESSTVPRSGCNALTMWIFNMERNSTQLKCKTHPGIDADGFPAHTCAVKSWLKPMRNRPRVRPVLRFGRYVRVLGKSRGGTRQARGRHFGLRPKTKSIYDPSNPNHCEPMLKQKRKVVVSLHGIRTRGLWQKEVAPVISEQGWIYYPLDYGDFSPFQLISEGERNEKIEWFRNEINDICQKIAPIIPSVIAHSFGTFIVCNTLDKYRNIHLDKLILCGSILPQDFDWKKIIDRKQVTMVKNDCGGKDFWAGISGKFVAGTGPSGRAGFNQKHERLIDDQFERFEHSDFFGYDHYVGEWVPFLEKDMAYVGETETLGQQEEPVSPIEAARWSAMTYYHQFITRAVNAIRNDEVYTIVNPESAEAKAGAKPEQVKAKGLVVAIPSTPGGAKDGAIMDFSKNLNLKNVNIGKSPRTLKYGADGYLYDVPTILQTLSFLDHRQNDELAPAVIEFQRMIEKILDGPDGDERAYVQTKAVADLCGAASK